MADKTLSSGDFCRPYRSPWGAFPTRTLQLSTGISSAAINLGGLIRLDDRSTAVTNRVYQTVTPIEPLLAGIAAEAVTTPQAAASVTHIPVWEANPMVEFKAVTKNGTLQPEHVGSGKALAWDSTLNLLYVDLGNSSAGDARVLVTELIDQVGDSGGYVAFRFLPGDRTSTAAPSSFAYLAFYGR